MYIDKDKLNCNVIPEGKKFLAYVGIGTGKDRKRIKARGATEDEAVAKLEQKLIDMGFVAPPANTPKLVMTVNKFTSIPDFVKEYRVNGVVEDVENGIITSRAGENYIYMLDHFERYFRFATVGDITVNVLNQFFKAEAEKYAKSTYHKVKWIVRKMFNRAERKKWIAYNPFGADGYVAPKSKKTGIKINGLKPEELREFLRTIKEYSIIYNPIMLMLNTGMRTQEVIGLKWRDIDFRTNRLFVNRAVTIDVEFDEEGKVKSRKSIISKTKTEGSRREIGLTPEAKEILLTWKEEAPRVSMTKLGDDDFVFGYEKKPCFTYCAFRDRVNDYLTRQAGSIDKMRLHRCRHTVATLLVAQGRELLQIMQQLGITEEKTLKRYVDEPGNEKIIAENVDAISKGLSDMINRANKKAVDNDETMKLILSAAENLTDDRTKALILALAGVVQKA